MKSSSKFRAYMFENFITITAVCSAIAYNAMIYSETIRKWFN